MSRYLYLMRHAQSAEKQNSQSDEERVLTPFGISQAIAVGRYLKHKKTSLDMIICSVAERAKVTASLVSEELSYASDKIRVMENLYEASSATFLEIISKLEDNLRHVMFVAHNPSITYLVENIACASISDIKPASIAIIEVNIDSWQEIKKGNGKLLEITDANQLIK